jgi:hypothetical protein
MSLLSKAYGDFLAKSFNFKYFITIRTPYKKNTMTVSNWIDRFVKNSTTGINSIFYVNERDKGDVANTHTHMLIDSVDDLSYKQIKKSFGNLSVGDFQKIDDCGGVCGYVTKWIDRDVQYDIFINM